jgi:hypothetical protein
MRPPGFNKTDGHDPSAAEHGMKVKRPNAVIAHCRSKSQKHPAAVVRLGPLLGPAKWSTSYGGQSIVIM